MHNASARPHERRRERPERPTAPERDEAARDGRPRALRPGERLILELVLHEHAHEHIADFLGVPVSAVRAVAERALGEDTTVAPLHAAPEPHTHDPSGQA